LEVKKSHGDILGFIKALEATENLYAAQANLQLTEG